MVTLHDNSLVGQFGGELASPALAPVKETTVANALFDCGHEFNFFQAVSILEAIYPDRQPVGTIGRSDPAVHFAARSSSHSFAASAVHEIAPATTRQPVARMTVGFMGLTGPAGILPIHYTEMLRRIELEAKGPQKYALRDWFDLFNDRLIALFYQSWKKYRPYTFHAAALRGAQDKFSTTLQSLAGLGMPSLSHQVRSFVPRPSDQSTTDSARENQPAQTRNAGANLSLLRYTGLLSQRPRCASNLQQLLEDYFDLPFEVKQFHGNWLTLDESAQTRLGVRNGNSILGVNAVIGDQTWERQNKIRVIVGPLSRRQFTELMPDHESEFAENDLSLLTELIRLFVGAEMEFDIQIKLSTNVMPEAKLGDQGNAGMRLGWNSWLSGKQDNDVVEDTVFSYA